MPVRTRIVDGARTRSRVVLARTGDEIRRSRMASGLTLRVVGSAAGRSASWLSRVERGLIRSVSVEQLIVVAAAAGLDVWVKTYPGPRAILDSPQLDLLRRFRQRVGEQWTWQFEAILPIPLDQRAADALLRRGSTVIMVEAFTRLTDAQAQLRAVYVKARDLGVERIVVVAAGTRSNRRALAAGADVLATSFPLSTRATLSALRAGRDPGANGLVLL